MTTTSLLKVAFIHNEKKVGTGAHYINDLMAKRLQACNIDLNNFYPKATIVPTPVHLNGLKNILFFYSLLEHRDKILKHDIIQGTTYTPLPFLSYNVPVLSHFGSTTQGFLSSTPMAADMENGARKMWYRLRKANVIPELNIQTRKPLRDIRDIETFVALRATRVIATSRIVYQELRDMGVPDERLSLIHNAIEDYWFEGRPNIVRPDRSIVFLGRIGHDAFTHKLKGVARLLALFEHFKDESKYAICMSTNHKLLQWMRSDIPRTQVIANLVKDQIPALLAPRAGAVLFIPSRYEGFSLSLIEGMSRGLVPVMFPVGVAPEIIQQGVNGFIVHSLKEAKEVVGNLLENDDLRYSCSLAAMRSADAFTSEEMARHLIALYEDVLAQHPGDPRRKILRQFRSATNS